MLIKAKEITILKFKSTEIKKDSSSFSKKLCLSLKEDNKICSYEIKDKKTSKVCFLVSYISPSSSDLEP